MAEAGLDEHSPEAAATESTAEAPHSRSPWRWLIEWIAVIAVAALLAVGVRTFVLQTFFIPSGSMEPTLMIGDRILVFKLAYTFSSPQTGDVVVFKAPPDEHCGPPVSDLVKRIVGLPGQWISSRGNTIFINHRPLHQTWSHWNPLGTQIVPQRIAPDHYFMLGDNHNNSCDSRYWGTLPGSDIIGKVILKIWPLSQFGTI